MLHRIFIIILVCTVCSLNAQINWINKNIFEQKDFIENKGQIDINQLPNREPVLYAAFVDGVAYYFTKNGYTISHSEKKEITKNEIEDAYDKRDKKGKGEKEFNFKIVEKFHELKWEGANPLVQILADHEVKNYYSYSDVKSPGKNRTILAHAYSAIIYKELYPYTDVRFEFPADSSGIKYSIYLHPGADVEKIRMSFPDDDFILNSNNDLEINAAFGKIIDHHPVAFTSINLSPVKSNFKVIKNQLGFGLANNPTDQTIIIDPWIKTPPLGTFGNPYDVDYDNLGNVYIYGGSFVGPYKLLKYDPSGTLLWSYTPSLFSGGGFYGDFAVDRNSNAIYLVQGINEDTGARVVKINSSAIVQATFGGNLSFREMWRVSFSKCTNQAVIAGGGTSFPSYQTCFLDTNLTALTPVQFIPTTNCCHDVCELALDNYGNCYEVTMDSGPYDTIFNNQLVKLPLPGLLPVSYNVRTNYQFREVASNHYSGFANGYNGLTTSNTTVFSYDGYTLKKWDGPTGNLLMNKTINIPLFGDPSQIYWGGISADDCGNLFLADSNSVRQYDTALNIVNSYAMPGIINDLNFNSNGTLYVCGQNFVSSLIPADIINCNIVSLTLTAIDATCNNAGSATAVVTGGIPPYTIEWNTSPVQYGTMINLLPGTYTATVRDGSCPQSELTATVTINGSGNSAIYDLLKSSRVNTFSPNNDGNNDLFFPFEGLATINGGNYFESYNLQIFDRWGNKVFETSKPDGGWNGTSQKNKKADDGVYYWITEIKAPCEKESIVEKGFVQLVR